MIGFFPKPYKDELLYSLLARYFSMSGYRCYSSVAEDLFENPKNKPSIEFLNPLTKDVLNQVGNVGKLIMEHTLFPYYSAFIPKERQKKAYHLACDMQIKKLINALPIPKCKTMRYLRYCPKCAIEDRNRFGETFWHRTHNLFGVTACQIHECKLIDSNIPITSNASPSLITAEEYIERFPSTTSQALPAEVKLSKYLKEILEINAEPKMEIGEFLDSYIRTTKYVSPRGVKRNLEALSKDFKDYYQGIDLYGFGEPSQIEKVLNGYRYNPFIIGLFGAFLDIQATTLLDRKKRCANSFFKGFDNGIRQLKLEGYNYRQISEKVGLSYDYVKKIAYAKKPLRTNRAVSHKGGKRINWEYLDKETMPKVIDLVTKLKSAGVRKPQAISIGKVERLLELREGSIKKLPNCSKYVNDNLISQEEFWAKTIGWAITKLKAENKPINITNVINITNIRKEKIINSFPYLSKYLDDELVMQLEQVFLYQP